MTKIEMDLLNTFNSKSTEEEKAKAAASILEAEVIKTFDYARGMCFMNQEDLAYHESYKEEWLEKIGIK